MLGFIKYKSRSTYNLIMVMFYLTRICLFAVLTIGYMAIPILTTSFEFSRNPVLYLAWYGYALGFMLAPQCESYEEYLEKNINEFVFIVSFLRWPYTTWQYKRYREYSN